MGFDSIEKRGPPGAYLTASALPNCQQILSKTATIRQQWLL